MGWEKRLIDPNGDRGNYDTKSEDPIQIENRIDSKYKPIIEASRDEVLTQYNSAYTINETPENLKEILEEITTNVLRKNGLQLGKLEESKIVQYIIDDIMGMGPIEPLLRDSTVSEIMVNSAEQVYVERKGKLELSGVTFRNDAHVMQIISRIVSAVGRRCDESTPMVDARLADGSRFNAVIPPIALKGPSMTIRKFSKNPLTIRDLVGFGSMSSQMAAFLEAAVKGRCNVVVSGGTGSGKTTLLNVLSGFIPETDRIVTIEDAAELQLEQSHVVTLESRPNNAEGSGAVTIRDLVRNALRMRPDRIVVGEVRSGESLDMLQAMNTGHDGSLTTLHANTPRDVISRLETMVLMGGVDLPAKAIREQIAAAIDIIVHQTRMRDGSRKIISITEVVGIEGEAVTTQELFTFKQTADTIGGKVSGIFTATGVPSRNTNKMREYGVVVKDDWFIPKTEGQFY